jgi:hypothetical protein
MPEAQLQTGNGITLCMQCHREVHEGFNGLPDLNEPMDAQGGEKIDTMERLYQALCEDAYNRELLSDEYYYLSDSVLAKFKMFQGFGPYAEFGGLRIQQAFWIWRACPQNLLRAHIVAFLSDEIVPTKC